MSLLSRNAVGVALFPDRLIIARSGGALFRRVKQKEIVTLAPSPAESPLWGPALEALQARAAEGAFAGADATLILSSQFVHYAVVPWSEGLASGEEQRAFVQHCFTRAYGSQAAGWVIRTAYAHRGGPRLACGVEAALVEGLERAMSPLGPRYRSLQPHLMASYNCCRARLGLKPAWFVVAEPGVVCVSRLESGRWHSVRSIRVGPDWAHRLPSLLAREECLVDCATDCDRVIVFCPDAPDPVTGDAGTWAIEKLVPRLLPGMEAQTDSTYGITVGV